MLPPTKLGLRMMDEKRTWMMLILCIPTLIHVVYLSVVLCWFIFANGTRFWIESAKNQLQLHAETFSLRQTIAETRADIDYEYHLALAENRLHDARRIRFEGRFIVLKAVAYDLVVTFFEYATDNVKNLFRLG